MEDFLQPFGELSTSYVNIIVCGGDNADMLLNDSCVKSLLDAIAGSGLISPNNEHLKRSVIKKIRAYKNCKHSVDLIDCTLIQDLATY